MLRRKSAEHFEPSVADADSAERVLRQVRPTLVVGIGGAGWSEAWIAERCRASGVDMEFRFLTTVGMGNVPPMEQIFSAFDSHVVQEGAQERRRRILLLLCPMGGADATRIALESVHGVLGVDDVVCVLSEGSRRKLKPFGKGGSGADGLARFLMDNPVRYVPLEFPDSLTGLETEPILNMRCIRATGLELLPSVSGSMVEALRQRILGGEVTSVFEELNRLKAGRVPLRGVDFLRAVCFLREQSLTAAVEAVNEELRYFPDNEEALAMRRSLFWVLFPPPVLGDEDFKTLYAKVRPYTMMSEARLHSLFELARRVCRLDLPGDFVECGVAGGGSTALVAAVVAKESRRPRRVYACDTFSGMPDPSDRDIHQSSSAEESGWGAGTCAAPQESLLEISWKLGVTDIVVPVVGLFADSLPKLRLELESVAFLHMDGDWYESTRDILVNLYDKVVEGAPVQVDDYGYWQGCREALEEFQKEHGLHFGLRKIDFTGVWFTKSSKENGEILVNLGCGRHFHPDWRNFDLVPSEPSILAHDLRKPLPLETGSCRAVYHSHVLEHLPKETVSQFLAECFRVLSPGGVLRVVVPDLEAIARLYLENLMIAAEGDADAADRHEWMTIELIDQLTRHRKGGEMRDFWLREPLPCADFLVARMGDAVRRAREKSERRTKRARRNGEDKDRNFSDSIREEDPATVGAFRLGGEVHRWMYDRVSLKRILEQVGFIEFTVRGASDSAILGFAGYELDAELNGRVRKPDSIFVEARKPLLDR